MLEECEENVPFLRQLRYRIGLQNLVKYDVACRIQVEIGANRLRSAFNDPRNKPLARANARMRPDRTQTLGILVRRPNIGRSYWSHSDLISFW